MEDSRGYQYDETEDDIAEVKEQGKKWWPLLLLPLAFFIGWAGNEALDNRDDTRVGSLNERVQTGVGGGPGYFVPCPTDGTNN